VISKSPFNDQFEFEVDHDGEIRKIDGFIDENRKTVVIQGLGFVGTAMVAALSQAKRNDQLIYNVIGIDLPDEGNYWKIGRVNSGKAPVISADVTLDEAYEKAHANGNILATYSDHAYEKADVVVIDINLDIEKKALGDPYDSVFSYDGYIKAIEAIAKNIKEDTLVIVESTVPPGTTEKVLLPVFKKHFEDRNLDVFRLHLAHSYERVMPGKEYLSSITDFYRVYSAIDDVSKAKTRKFLETFINTNDFPLNEMHSTVASEMSKVLENSFRAMNIAFIQEWTEFAEKAGVNLFEVIGAIRVRPTHRNIMAPGFGVGGYCLTKDSLLADWAYNNLFESQKRLEMSLNAISTNDLMPGHTFTLLKSKFDDLKGVNIALLGLSYLNDVADTRYSPSEYFFDMCEKEGAIIRLHDPIVKYWQEKDLSIDTNIKHLKDHTHDVAVFAVRHSQYIALDHDEILSLLPGLKLVVDANNIISDGVARSLKDNNVDVLGVGKGHW
jgi:nucleotide sugar dehydrogenase